MAEIAYVGLGSNVGDRMANLRRAVELLGERVRVRDASPVYETEPVGYLDQPWFLNCVVAVEAPGRALDLLAATKEVEAVMGKATPFPDGPRVIDLDVLLHGAGPVDSASLHVPHHRMHLRRFVLVPLADLAPEAVIPGLGVSVAEALGRLRDAEEVRLYTKGPWTDAPP